MPTVHRERGFAFRIYPKDHEPPHVHAIKAGGFVKVQIGSESIAPRIMKVGKEMTEHDVVKAVRIVEREWRMLLEAWRRVHGQYESH